MPCGIVVEHTTDGTNISVENPDDISPFTGKPVQYERAEYDRRLTVAECADVWLHLADKWGVTP